MSRTWYYLVLESSLLASSAKKTLFHVQSKAKQIGWVQHWKHCKMRKSWFRMVVITRELSNTMIRNKSYPLCVGTWAITIGLALLYQRLSKSRDLVGDLFQLLTYRSVSDDVSQAKLNVRVSSKFYLDDFSPGLNLFVLLPPHHNSWTVCPDQNLGSIDSMKPFIGVMAQFFLWNPFSVSLVHMKQTPLSKSLVTLKIHQS